MFLFVRTWQRHSSAELLTVAESDFGSNSANRSSPSSRQKELGEVLELGTKPDSSSVYIGHEFSLEHSCSHLNLKHGKLETINAALKMLCSQNS